MLLRIWPDAPLNAISYDLSFKDNLGADVEAPQTWLNQLQCVIQSGLDAPQSALAFDKSVWAVCLLEDVHFKMAEQLVTCLFIDGSRVDFPLRCNSAGRLLYSVVSDTCEALEATDMERAREAALMRIKRASTPGCIRPISPVKPTTRHKKHRSLLISLITYATCSSI